MRRVIIVAFSVFLLCSGAFGVELKPTIALSPDYQGPGSELIITWFPLSGKSYNIEAAAQLTGPWAALNPQPLLGEETVQTYRDQTPEPVRFYRIRKLDTEPPEVVYLNPRDGAIAVGRSEPLVVKLSDETGINPQSISFSLGAGSPIGIDDPRLVLAEHFLVYTPAADESYGGYGETVTATLSVSDTLGRRLENYTWSFKLELETVLADNVILIDDGSPLKLISLQGDAYTFSYSGDSPGISLGDILVSTDPGNPYKVKVVSLTDHPDSHTVDVLTELPTLPEIFERASFRVGNAPSEGQQVAPLSPGWPWRGAIHVEQRFPLDGTVVYEGEHLKVEFTSGFIELVCDVSIGGEIGWPSLLESFDLDLTGTVNFDATVKASASGEIKREFENNIATLPLPPFAKSVLGVPIVVTPALSFDVGMSAEANAQGEITAGISSSYTVSAGVTMRDGTWSPYRTCGGEASPIPPTWNVQGRINLKAYGEVEIAACVEGLIQPSLDLAPYLEFDGRFQGDPFAYDYALHAGVTSDLAIDISFLRQDPKSWRLLYRRRPLSQETYPREPKSGTVTWSRTFRGEVRDSGMSVQQTTDGGFIVAGVTESFGAGSGDAYLTKTDASGKEGWFRTFGGESWDVGWSVQQTTDGGFIVAGGTGSFGAGDCDVYLIKTDANGEQAWTGTFGAADFEFAYFVQQTTDGGFIVAGGTRSFGQGDYQVYLIKTDANGKEEWSRTLGRAGDGGRSVQQTTDGGFIVVGYTTRFQGGADDIYLIKTDFKAREEWSRTFGGASLDFADSLRQTTDGGFVVAGSTTSFGGGGVDAYLIKTDVNGKEEWTKTFGGADDDWGDSVQQTADGGFIIAGSTTSFGGGGADVYLIKTDVNGKEEWTKTFGGADDDWGDSVQQTTDGGFIVAGDTLSFGAGNRAVYLIKTDRFGNAPSVPSD